jgi:hypothetical protein
MPSRITIEYLRAWLRTSLPRVTSFLHHSYKSPMALHCSSHMQDVVNIYMTSISIQLTFPCSKHVGMIDDDFPSKSTGVYKTSSQVAETSVLQGLCSDFCLKAHTTWTSHENLRVGGRGQSHVDGKFPTSDVRVDPMGD